MKTNYIWSFCVALFLVVGTSIGQTTLIDETFTDGTAPAGWSTENMDFPTGAGGYAHFLGLDSELVSPNFDASAFGQIEINFEVAKFGVGDDGPVTVEVSTDGGDNFSVVGDSPVPTSSTYVDASFTVTSLSDDMVLRFSRPNSVSAKRFKNLEVIASGTPGGGDVDCDITVRVFSTGWGDNVTWQLTNSLDEVVLSGGTYGNGYDDEQTHIALNPPYTFSITVDDTTFCDNAPNWEISIGDELETSDGISAACQTITETYAIAADLTPCIPSCPAPIGIVSTELTIDGGSFAWSEVDVADSYDWFVYNLNDDIDTATPVASGNTTDETLTVTGLDANTDYKLVLQSDCGAEEGNLSIPFEFKTACGAQSGDFVESFNTTSTGQIPDCWNGITNSTANALLDVVAFGLPFNGPNQLRTSSSGDIDTEHFFVSPVLTDLDQGRRVTFYARQTTATAANSVEVGVMSDPEDETTFVSLETFVFAGSTIDFFVADIPDSVTEEHFAFRFSFNAGTGTSGFQTIYLDEISYEATPPCDFIDGLVIDGFGQNTVDFSWDALPNAVSYDWEVYEAGDEVGVDTPVADGNSPTNSASAAGLEPNTSYFVVVSGDCGPDDGTGANSAPATFKTLCDAFSSPFGEDFEDAASGSLPDCWLTLDSAETSGAFNITTFGTPMQGSQQLQSSSGNNDGVQRFLISPELTDLTDNDKRVTFFARTTNTVANNASIALGIMNDPNDPNTFIELNSWALTTTPTLYQGDVNFAFTETHFAIRFTYAATFVTAYLDDIQYFDVPACDVPQEVVNEGLSFTTADFSWNPVPSAESYNWVVVAQGDDPTDEDDIVAFGNTVNTEVTAEDLEEETEYEFYVKTDCDTLGEGEFSLPVSFFTGYCVPSTANTGDYITNFTTTDALTNVSIIKSAISPNGYANLSATEIITVFPGSSFDFSNTFNFANNNVGIWIDWNDNLIFELDEQEFQAGDTTTATETGTIDIPSDVALGSYRLRLRARWGQSPLVTPCGAQTFADAMDFTLLVVEEPDCLSPSDLVVDDVTTDTVNFSWEAVPTAESYVWQIYAAAAVVGEDTPVDSGTAVDTDASSTALSANTPYKIVVKTICGEDSESLFSSPVNFRTECGPVFAPFNEGFEDTATTQIPFCWNRILDFVAGTPLVEVTTFSVPAFGSRQIRFNSSSDADAELTLVSPELADLDGTPKRVTFFARQLTSTQTNSLEVGIMSDPEDASTFEVVQTIDFSGNTMQFFAVNFLDVDNETHFAFRPAFAATFQTILLDEVTYEEIPACDVPFGVAGDLASSSSAIFTWDEVLGAESYDWILVSAGDDPEEASNILQSGNVPENEVLVENLVLNEEYDFYVSAECGAEGVGELSDPATISVSTCIEGVGPTSAADTHISLIEFFGEVGSGIDIQNNCPAQLGVQDETETDVFVFAGETYTMTVEKGFCTGNVYGHTGAVWIDFNQNLTFDEDTETMATWSGVFGVVELENLSIEIPEGTPFGEYRGRVMMREGIPLQPCASFAFGSVIDFTVTVVDPDDIPAQTANLQVIHNSPDLLASSVDVYVNGALLPELTGLDFRHATAFLPVPAGVDLEVDVVPAGGMLSESVHNETFNLVADENYIVVANGVLDPSLITNAPFELSVYAGARLEANDPANVDILVHHGSPDAPAVDVSVPGFGVVVDDISFPEFEGYLFIAPQSIQIEILPTGQSIPVAIYSAPLGGFAGDALTVIASGFLGDDQVESNKFGLWVATAAGGALLELTEVTASNAAFDVNNFSYYPNPVRSNLTIQSASSVEKIEVYNMLGQRVMLTKPNTTNPSIEMGDLTSGVYIMNVSINGNNKNFQIIKE